MAAALELVFGRLSQPARHMQIAEALAEIQRTGGEGHIVFIARRDGTPVGAVWAQIQPGRVASLWLPGLTAGEPDATAAALVDLAVSKAAQAGAVLVQSLLENTAKAQSQWLRQCGFRHATNLLYLVCPREKWPTSKPQGELIFEQLAEVSGADSVQDTTQNFPANSNPQMRRLAAIVQRTYEQTKDCPAVQGVRSVDDVLISYRGVGQFDPSKWYIVRDRQTHDDIGCLLLTEYRQAQNWELVYMGVAPQARGRKLGLQIVRHAQWLAHEAAHLATSKSTQQSTIERLVLAVDAANAPAVAMYLAADFEVWDRRSVFLREIA
jgi:ribosomal protein S18 acetylase RimI-like enzyme